MSEKFEQEAIDAYQYNRQDNLPENGVLTVTMKKRAETQPKKIAIG